MNPASTTAEPGRQGGGWERLLQHLACGSACTDVTIHEDGRWAVRRQRAWAVVAAHEAERPSWSELPALLGFAEGEAGTRTVGLGAHRLRANLARDARGWMISIRLLPAAVPTPEQLLLPEGLADRFASLDGGLALVGGRTGMGKSSTIAALIAARADRRGGKYVTLENPVEFVHRDTARAFFSQRQVGGHVRSYGEGLIEAMHQNPDVIVVQEIVDAASAEAALAAALTGHLVIGTLHAHSAATLPQRFVSLVSGAGSGVERWTEALAASLQLALVQELVPGGDRLVPLFEILTCAEGGAPLPSVQRLLRTGNWVGLRQEMESGARHGMATLSQSRQLRLAEGWPLAA